MRILCGQSAVKPLRAHLHLGEIYLEQNRVEKARERAFGMEMADDEAMKVRIEFLRRSRCGVSFQAQLMGNRGYVKQMSKATSNSGVGSRPSSRPRSGSAASAGGVTLASRDHPAASSNL